MAARDIDLAFPRDIDLNFPSRTALVVDDEDSVRRLVKRILLHHGFVVSEARDGHEGLALINQNALNCAFHLLITDIKMPGLDGIALADHFSIVCPRAGVILISGYIDVESINLESPTHRWMFVPKPFLPRVLIAAVETVSGRD